MEMLIMVYACKTSCAKSITGVLPYFPYSKQCKMRKRGSIVSKLIACMMCKAGECRAVSSHGLGGVHLTCMWSESARSVFSHAVGDAPMQVSPT